MQTASGLTYQIEKPPPKLANFVESFWRLTNPTDQPVPVIVLPDGRFDVIYSFSPAEPRRTILTGLGSKPEQQRVEAGTLMYAVSFRLLALEYLLQTSIANLGNDVQILPADFWGITDDDLSDLSRFSARLSHLFAQRIPAQIDPRKQTLQQLIYATNGSIPVGDLAQQTGWSSRQINRYFTRQLGVSLKTYCTMLRFRASFQHLREGRLFPEENFTDQAHFIREVRKYAGVTPRGLAQNADDRFIQLSTLTKP
ncbi:helix-turn-helix domain-containing protein [Fibrella sp. WM1]|uniref:helix-turn-helix domain-containing protein n=1 Tax=Fibrella musci TaxID=3242485 RepID=UPI003520E404